MALAFLAIVTTTPYLFASDCISISAAGQHIGEVKCVTGKVVRVQVGTQGIHFIHFCEDEAACPFYVVVFPYDLKDVGDVRNLPGRQIEIRGELKLYDGRPEMILSRISQISGGAAMIPALPKNYDVEKTGHYSAGRLRPTKRPKRARGRPSPTATYGNEADVEEP